MIVEDISPQAVAHDSGAVVASTGRTSFVYARAGRTIALAVEPLDTYFVRLPADPSWDDGTRLTQADADQLATRYAAEASGQVTVTVRDVLVTSVFLQRDLPALRANPRVTALRIVDAVTGDERILPRGEF